jgi:hypothetical protein
MYIDFRAPGGWSALNDYVAQQLHLETDKCVPRIYQTTTFAVVEIALGLAKLFPNRKKVYYFKNMDPTFEPVAMALAKEGYQTTPLNLSVLAEPQSFVSGLGREDLFVLYSCDEPILGRAYDVSKLEAVLATSSVFKIRVSHASHFLGRASVGSAQSSGEGQVANQPSGVGQVAALPSGQFLPDRNSAHVFALRLDQALALLGERARVGSIAAEQAVYNCHIDLKWLKGALSTDAKELNAPTGLTNSGAPTGSTNSGAPTGSSHEKLVLEFEKSRPAQAQVFFAEDAQGSKGRVSRLFDRAVIYWLDLDGHAVIDRLAKELKMDLAAPGFEHRLETTSLSRWGGLRTMDFLKSQLNELGHADPATILRGLVIISADLLEAHPQMAQLLLRVRESILKDQQG